MPKILLVEDNDSNRDLIARYLELFGHEVAVAADGQEGLERARAQYQDIDVVLMDISLREMDGCDVTRQLKADEATKSLPVIAITAHAMQGDREKALQAGCDEYVAKPIDFDVLLNKIDTLSRQGLKE